MMPPSPSARARLGSLSRDLIFELLRERRQTTRTELARLSGLSKGTVSVIVSELLRHGFLHEVGKHQAGRGRSQIILQFDPTARLVFGAQLGERTCTVILADLSACPQATMEVPVQGLQPDDLLAAVCKGVEHLRSQTKAPVLGLGIGVPGMVDGSGRSVRSWLSGGWQNVPVADLLEERLCLPVVAANRAQVAALGEKWHGAAKGIDSIAYIFLGNGIVAGLLINGTLYTANGIAGQIDHIPIMPDGSLCTCGARGCLHTLAAGPAIVNLARAKARLVGDTVLRHFSNGQLEQITFDMVIEAAQQGDPVALETVSEAGTYVGIAVAVLVNILNPQMVILGGPVGRLGAPMLEPVQREVWRRALSLSMDGLMITSSSLGEEAGAIGAAALFLENLVSLSTVTMASDDDEQATKG